MASRRPLVLNAGKKELLQSGDSLDIGGYDLPFSGGSEGTILVMGASDAAWTTTTALVLTLGGVNTTGNIIIDSDSSTLTLGADTDYTVGWNGGNAVHTISAGAFNFEGGALKPYTVNTTQRDAITPVEGMIVYNSTTKSVEKYEDSVWSAGQYTLPIDGSPENFLKRTAGGYIWTNTFTSTLIAGGFTTVSGTVTTKNFIAKDYNGDDILNMQWYGTDVNNSYLALGGSVQIGLIDGDAILRLGSSGEYLVKWDGGDAVHTIAVTAAFEFDGGAIRFPNVTTTQRDALSAANGMVIYNTTDNQFQTYENGSWVQKATVITGSLDLYVKTTGNDSTGDGSSGLPWATIDKALAVVGDWVLMATVTINIEKGDYTDTGTLEIKHSNGNFLEIVGDSVEESLTMTASGGSSGAYWYTFATSNTDDYTVGDNTLNYSAASGSNPSSTLGVLECISKVNGVSVTLQSPLIGTQATGSVVAELVTPQVQWIRKVTIESSLANLEGIQQQYNATSTWTYVLQVNPFDAVTIYINNYTVMNTNATRYGTIRTFPNSFVQFAKYGARNLTASCFVDDNVWLYNSNATDCTVGFRAYGGGKISYVGICMVENTTGFRAELMSLCIKGGGSRVMIGNTTDASPAFGTEGNQNSYMGA